GVEAGARDDAAQGSRAASADRSEEVVVWDQDEAIRAGGEAAAEAPVDDRDGPCWWRAADRVNRRGGDVRVGEDLGQAGGRVGGDHDARAVSAPPLDRLGKRAAEGRRHGRLVPAEGVAAGRGLAV